jgi:hypothetical protein
MSAVEFYIFQPEKPFGVFRMTAENTLGRYLKANYLPQTAYLYFPKKLGGRDWYRTDLTPVLLDDVPKQYRAAALLIT